MKDREKWMGKLKEKLQDYSEPVPLSGWEQLEEELISGENTPVLSDEKRMPHPYRRWTAVAAVVLLLVTSSLSIYFLNTPAADEMRHTSTTMLSSDSDVLPSANEPEDVEVMKVEPLRPRPVIAQVKITAKRQEKHSPVPEEYLTETVNETSQATDVTGKPEKNRDNVIPESEKTENNRVRPDRRTRQDKLHIPAEKTKSRKGRWSVGAAVGNGGGMTLTGSDAGIQRQHFYGDQRLNLIPSEESDIIRIPDNQIVYIKEGMPYVKNVDEVVDIEHHQPVSFGLSIRKGLVKGFSLETGVTYTLLSSDVQMSGNLSRVDQKLHYIGIPVRANWNFFDKDRFTLYVAAGGMVEKCVYGKRGSDHLKVNPLQFSVSGALGAQFNATRHVGIYVEPGVAYFFDDGSSIQTIRKETPCNFNLQGGIRFTY